MFVEHKSDGEVLNPSLASFIAWLEQMPADGKYDWKDPAACACGQYARWWLGDDDWMDLREGTGPMWTLLNQLALGPVDVGRALRCGCEDWTFGKLLQRAREARERCRQARYRGR